MQFLLPSLSRMFSDTSHSHNIVKILNYSDGNCNVFVFCFTLYIQYKYTKTNDFLLSLKSISVKNNERLGQTV